MMLALLIAILTAVLAGLVCTVALWTRRGPTAPRLVLVTSLAVGLGFGLSSCASVLALKVFSASRHGFIVTDVGLLLFLGIVGVWAFMRRASREAADAPIAALPASRCRWLLSASLAITLACALLSFVLLSLKNPHGWFDAWSIWNMRARFFARAGSHWPEAF